MGRKPMGGGGGSKVLQVRLPKAVYDQLQEEADRRAELGDCGGVSSVLREKAIVGLGASTEDRPRAKSVLRLGAVVR